MKQGWKYEKLGEVCEIFGRIGFRGYTRKDYVNTMEEGAISLSPSNIKNNQLVFSNCTYITWDKYNQSPEIMISKGDVVFVKTASIGKCAYVSELPHETTINPQFVVFKNIKISNRFLFHQLQSPSFQNKVKSITTGTSVPTISQKGLSELEISYPDSISEQERIVERLDAAFAQIDELKRNAERQLAEARALFQSALTQSMQPKPGWQEKTLRDCVNKIPKQKQVKSKDYQPSGKYPIVSQEKDIISGYWDDESFLYKHERPVIIFGDHTKEIKYIDFDFVVGADGTQILSPKDGLVAKFFYYALLATPIRNLGYARHFKLLKEVLFYVPQMAEQQRVVEYLDSLTNHVKELEEISRKTAAECDALKQALLRQIFE